ncbi:MAG: response regulator [Gammaproteobacteria bacterium]|nr:response regulator [Gammaproteobacteria bacterium]
MDNDLDRKIDSEDHRPTLVVVDDEFEMAGFVAEVAEVVGYRVSAVTSVQALRQAFSGSQADVMVIDIFMPDTDGFELIGELADQRCSSEIILISGYGKTLLEGAAKIARARGLKLRSVISKPFRLAELQSALRDVYRQFAAGST